MTLRHFATAYAATALVFLALDAVWLSTMASRLYRPAIGHLLADGFALGPAVAFYAMYVAGVVVFAVAPALASGRWLQALMLGAGLGLLCYGTYDLTNQATLRDWPLKVTLIDLAWGATVTASSAAAATWLTLKIFGQTGPSTS